MTRTLDRSQVLTLLAELVRINSINPAYADGRPEADVAYFLRDYFARHTVETFLQEISPGRMNLVAHLAGRNPSRRLVFEAHMDTVGITGMTIAPFEPSLSEGKLYGRGSCDTKAGLAAMVRALISIKQDAIVPPCEVWVVAAADEEHAFTGARRLLTGLTAVGAVVSEPTQMRVATASKGVLRWRIHCRGKAAHSSKPKLGRNAIVDMARVILTLEEENQRLASAEHPLLGHATLSVGIIQGGQGVNVVPEHCAIEVDRRLLPSETAGTVFERYRALWRASRGVEFELPMLEDEAMETPQDAEIVQTALNVCQNMGLSCNPIGVPFGTDASKFNRAGIPTIICGPGNIDQAHAAEEFVCCREVEEAVDFYRNIMLTFV